MAVDKTTDIVFNLQKSEKEHIGSRAQKDAEQGVMPPFIADSDNSSRDELLHIIGSDLTNAYRIVFPDIFSPISANAKYYLSLSNSRKAALQVRNDVVNVLRADGETDCVGLDVLLAQLLLAQLGVRRGRGMDYETLDIRNVRKQGEYL